MSEFDGDGDESELGGDSEMQMNFVCPVARQTHEPFSTTKIGWRRRRRRLEDRGLVCPISGCIGRSVSLAVRRVLANKMWNCLYVHLYLAAVQLHTIVALLVWRRQRPPY